MHLTFSVNRLFNAEKNDYGIYIDGTFFKSSNIYSPEIYSIDLAKQTITFELNGNIYRNVPFNKFDKLEISVGS
ncbi:hypothetical protein D6827_02935 [Candidatus Parcubacteria bacterium]|nr:MAG: hypothetical protein D6827_02935 [Candidatus Parcubacteria bacterium]